MNLYTIISVVAIPIVVMLLKKLNLPNKWCPIAAFAVALVLVAIGKAFGVDLDVNNIAQAIVAALATAGVSVLGYDAVKGLTEPKK
jgi:hypothetical protein